nr:EOG090X0DPX [Macrothrix elegans]
MKRVKSSPESKKVNPRKANQRFPQMDPLFKNVSLSPSTSGASSALLDSSDEASDERTSFIRSAKSHRKYGSTTSSSSMNDSLSPLKYQPTTYIEHRVQSGDTLVSIALRYQTTVEFLKRINKMWTSDTLFLRETILVPSPIDDFKSETPVARLVVENETNGSESTPSLDASSWETRTSFPEISLSSITIQPKTSLARASSSSSTSSSSIDCDASIQDYLGSIDSQIKEAKSKAQKLQKKSDVLKTLPDTTNQGSWPRSQQASSRLRLSLSNLGGVPKYRRRRIQLLQRGQYLSQRNLFENLYSVLQEYHYYVAAYLLISAIVSFALCYRFGPVTNPKTIHLLQWGLQVQYSFVGYP